MSFITDFEIKNGVLIKYRGSDADVIIPDGVTGIGRSAFYRSKATRITMPDSIKTIGDEAFSCCRVLESIQLSNNLKTIGENAFHYCTSLKELVIPASVELKCQLWSVIDECHKLERLVILSPSVFKKYHEDQTFSLVGLYSLKSLVYPCVPIQDITPRWRLAAVRGFSEKQELFTSQEIRDSYATYMVRQKKNVLPIIFESDNASVLDMILNASKTAVNQPEEMIAAAQSAGAAGCAACLLSRFQSMPKKDPFRVLDADPYSAAEIRKKWSCKKDNDGTYILTSYKGDETVITVPYRVGKTEVSALGFCLFSPYMGEFYWNASDYNDRKPYQRWLVMNAIEEVVIENGIQHIGTAAFYRCSALKKVRLPESLISIGQDAFADCTGIERIELPESLISIGRNAFADCTGIERIELPENLKKLDAGVFRGCIKLQDITVNENNSSFKSINGILFSKNLKKLVSYPGGKKEKEFTVPDKVKTICEAAFWTDTSLQTLIIPDGATTLSAFSILAESIKDVYIPSSVTALKNCFGWYLRPTIHAPAGSYAEQYAKEQKIPFVAEE